ATGWRGGAIQRSRRDLEHSASARRPRAFSRASIFNQPIYQTYREPLDTVQYAPTHMVVQSEKDRRSHLGRGRGSSAPLATARESVQGKIRSRKSQPRFTGQGGALRVPARPTALACA